MLFRSIRRENAGSWNSGLEKEQILETYSMQLQKSRNSTEHLKINKEKSSPKMNARGPTPCSRGWGRPPRPRLLPRGPPGGSPTSIFSYMRSFDEKKIRRNFSGRDSAATKRNLGGSNLELRQSCSAGDTSLREGEIITIIITNDPLNGRGSISINIFTSTISSQNPSSSLVSNLVTKPQIGTCGLLVVLITPCS